MRRITRRRLAVLTAALAVAVIAAIIFGGGFSAGRAYSFSRQQDAERDAPALATAAESTVPTIVEGSVSASTAKINQSPCD